MGTCCGLVKDKTIDNREIIVEIEETVEKPKKIKPYNDEASIKENIPSQASEKKEDDCQSIISKIVSEVDLSQVKLSMADMKDNIAPKENVDLTKEKESQPNMALEKDSTAERKVSKKIDERKNAFKQRMELISQKDEQEKQDSDFSKSSLQMKATPKSILKRTRTSVDPKTPNGHSDISMVDLNSVTSNVSIMSPGKKKKAHFDIGNTPKKSLLKRSQTSTFYEPQRMRERRSKKVKFKGLEGKKKNKKSVPRTKSRER